ncbi:MAG TPA: YciI family protein [Kofleriaceae bacterium]|nr:YciI family protein [Kofleriaceae bacterium]
MILVKSTSQSESGTMPSEKSLQEMTKFNEELVKAGILLAGEGLHPTSRGVRMHIAPDGKRTLIDGPFSETKELLAGFWMIQVKSREEALAWMRRIPDPYEGQGGSVELRQVFDAADFDYAPDIVDRENKMRAEIERQQQTK